MIVDIRYKLRNSINGQVLVDFVAKFTSVLAFIVGVCQALVQSWQVFVDGASNVRGVGPRIVMISLEGLRQKKSLRLGFQVSNNEAEYETFIVGLRTAQKLGAKEVEIFLNSRLVVGQVDGSFEVLYVTLFKIGQDFASMFLKSESG